MIGFTALTAATILFWASFIVVLSMANALIQVYPYNVFPAVCKILICHVQLVYVFMRIERFGY